MKVVHGSVEGLAHRHLLLLLASMDRVTGTGGGPRVGWGVAVSARVELRTMLNKVAMKRDEDPFTLFDQISAIDNKLNTKEKNIEEEELIVVVMAEAPEQYASTLTSESRRQK